MDRRPSPDKGSVVVALSASGVGAGGLAFAIRFRSELFRSIQNDAMAEDG